MANQFDANRSAVIVNYTTEFLGVPLNVTSTARRDEGAPSFAVATDVKNSTALTLNVGNTLMTLDGRQARTLYRLLRKHYKANKKTTVR